jgi:hypothetical protein
MQCSAYEVLDLEAVEHALTDDVTAAALRAAGYVQARPDLISPSAYPLNLSAVGLLTEELLNWVCGYRAFATCVVKTWREGRLQRSDRDNHPERPSPRCPVCSQLLGAGDSAALPHPPASGHVARLLAEARAARPLDSVAEPPAPGGPHGQQKKRLH